jgi:uncharacterized protein (DUF488 family)
MPRQLLTLYSIGHSTRSLEDFTRILGAHGIQILFDIRAFPMSRRLPHFNREVLERELSLSGVQYLWKKELGGRRAKIRDDSPNTGLRVQAFRNYADYMLTPAFEQAMAEVLERAENARSVLMCAEAVYFRCHRMLVSDWLVAHGHKVLHILDTGPPREHRLTPEARFQDGRLVYPGLFPE